MTSPNNLFYYLYNNKIPIKKFSVELTNRCALGCPNCSRTSITRKGFIHDISKTKQLDLDLIKKIFPNSLKDKNNGFVIDFTGNLGDAIYHPQFHEIIAYIKSINIKVQLTTNGSHRNKAWWEKTASILGPNDLVVFSVDGLKDTNHIYRINARWEDIMEAISVCVPQTHVQWKWIVFRHNEHQIEDAKVLAKSMGVHSFLINKSGRFAKDDPMMPQSQEWVGQKNRNKSKVREVLKTRNKLKRLLLGPLIPVIKKIKTDVTIDENDLVILPRCHTGEDAFISCEAHFFPCCYTRDMTKKSWFIPYLSQLNLSQRPLDDILKDPVWDLMEKTWNKPSCAPDECLRSCGVAKEYRNVYQGDSRSAEKDGKDNHYFVLNP